MVTNKNDVGCPDDKIIWVYNYSFLNLMRKSPNQSPTQFNQHPILVLDYVLKVANLVHLVTNKHMKRSIWWFVMPMKNAFQ